MNITNTQHFKRRLASLIAMILMLPPMLQFHPPLLGNKQNKFSGTDQLRHSRMNNRTWPDTCCGKSSPAATRAVWCCPPKCWSCCKMEPPRSCQQQTKGSWLQRVLVRGMVSFKLIFLNERFVSTLSGFSVSLRDAINWKVIRGQKEHPKFQWHF